MAQETLDQTGNEPLHRLIGKIAAMFTELYELLSGAAAASVASLTLGTGTKTASATAGAATLDKPSGVVTSESITTAAGSTYTLTLTNSEVTAASVVLVSLANGTNSQGELCLERVTPAAGSVVIVVRNRSGAEALNGTIKVAFAVIN